MLLKKADDKSKRLALLEDLQRSTVLDFSQKKWLKEELLRQKKGIQGERDSAFYLDSYFKEGVNHVVLHDLRFVFEGEVAQIDHLPRVPSGTIAHGYLKGARGRCANSHVARVYSGVDLPSASARPRPVSSTTAPSSTRRSTR